MPMTSDMASRVIRLNVYQGHTWQMTADTKEAGMATIIDKGVAEAVQKNKYDHRH